MNSGGLFMRVMVVDDEKPCVEELVYMISRFDGIEIAGALTNPFDAFREAARLKPDAVFLDICMPGLNGVDLAREIISNDAAIQIVFVTAYAKEFAKAEDFPASGNLLKPVSRHKLAEVLVRLKSSLPEA